MKKTDAPLAMFQSFVILATGIVAAVLGFVAMAGWILELPLLASFGNDLIPMAPSTAALFVLYGVAICLRVRTPLSRRADQISVAMGWLGTVVAILLFILQQLKREVNELCRHVGLTSRYQSQESELVASEAGRQDS